MKQIIIIALAFIAGWFCGKGHREPVGDRIITHVDTCVIYDTVVREKPVPRLVQIVCTDTVRIVTERHDTTYVSLPIERKTYEEDSLYRAVVTGYNAALESIEVWPRTAYITKEVTRTMARSRWSVGAAAGPSVLITPSGKMYGGLGASVGVSYSF